MGGTASTEPPLALHSNATRRCCPPALPHAVSAPTLNEIAYGPPHFRLSTALPAVASRPALVAAVLILGLIACGWFMTGRAEDDALAAWLYPNHKQFGMLVWLLAVVHLVVRWRERRRLPRDPHELTPWERKLSVVTQRLMIVLTLLTPLFGYAMSNTLPQSDGCRFSWSLAAGVPAEERRAVSRVPNVAPL